MEQKSREQLMKMLEDVVAAWRAHAVATKDYGVARSALALEVVRVLAEGGEAPALLFGIGDRVR